MKHESGSDGLFHYVLGELSYDDFDKTGRISMWKLAKLLEGNRFTINRYGPLVNLIDFNTSMMFLRSQSWKIYPAFYADNLTQNYSVKMNSFISHLGRTSYCLDTDVYNLITNKLLASVSIHAVSVSRQTRRPTPVLLNARQFINVMSPRDKRPVSDPEFPAPPSLHFTHKRTVMPSDTDSNQHLNQAAYIRFCFDCASKAALDGKLSGFTNDIIHSDTEAVWILYVHEAKVGEELTLTCWEDSDCNRTIWVQISRESQIFSRCQIKLNKAVPNDFKSESKNSLTVAKL